MIYVVFYPEVKDGNDIIAPRQAVIEREGKDEGHRDGTICMISPFPWPPVSG